MTEAGEKWLVDKLSDAEDIPEYGHMTAAMEFGIRAFCDEVEQSALVRCRTYDHVHLTTKHESSRNEGACKDSLGFALDRIKRELLGEDK